MERSDHCSAVDASSHSGSGEPQLPKRLGMTSERTLSVGDRVTVKTTSADPIELVCHAHCLVMQVQEDETAPGGAVYLIGHAVPGARRYGPFSADKLTDGW
jgi:hypothetical protein